MSKEARREALSSVEPPRGQNKRLQLQVRNFDLIWGWDIFHIRTLIISPDRVSCDPRFTNMTYTTFCNVVSSRFQHPSSNAMKFFAKALHKSKLRCVALQWSPRLPIIRKYSSLYRCWLFGTLLLQLGHTIFAGYFLE